MGWVGRGRGRGVLLLRNEGRACEGKVQENSAYATPYRPHPPGALAHLPGLNNTQHHCARVQWLGKGQGDGRGLKYAPPPHVGQVCTVIGNASSAKLMYVVVVF